MISFLGWFNRVDSTGWLVILCLRCMVTVCVKFQVFVDESKY